MSVENRRGARRQRAVASREPKTKYPENDLDAIEAGIRDQIINVEGYLRTVLESLNSGSGEELDKLLSLLGLSGMASRSESIVQSQNGKIVVFGPDKEPSWIKSIAKHSGICSDRLEYVTYSKAKSFNFRKLEHNDSYSAILIGQNPHSTQGTGDSASTLTNLQRKSNSGTILAKVVPLYNNSRKLAVTKDNYHEALKKLVNGGLV